MHNTWKTCIICAFYLLYLLIHRLYKEEKETSFCLIFHCYLVCVCVFVIHFHLFIIIYHCLTWHCIKSLINNDAFVLTFNVLNNLLKNIKKRLYWFMWFLAFVTKLNVGPNSCFSAKFLFIVYCFMTKKRVSVNQIPKSLLCSDFVQWKKKKTWTWFTSNLKSVNFLSLACFTLRTSTNFYRVLSI